MLKIGVSYIFEEFREIKLAKSIDRIVKRRVSSPDRSIKLINRVMDKVATGNHVVLQVVDLLE